MAEETKKTTPAADEKVKPPSREPAKDQGKDAAAPAEEAPVKAGKKFSPVLLIVLGLVTFVVFLGVFSYMMGVFSPKPPAKPEAAATGTPTADSAQGQTKQFVSDFGRAAAAVEASQQKGGIDTLGALSELDQRHKEIAAEEAKLDADRKELAALKAEVEQFLAQKKAIAGEKVLYLAKLLDGMKQEELGGLMVKLDDKTILAVLPSLKPQTASKVLALLPPERAAQLSTQLLNTEP